MHLDKIDSWNVFAVGVIVLTIIIALKTLISNLKGVSFKGLDRFDGWNLFAAVVLVLAAAGVILGGIVSGLIAAAVF